MEIWRIKTITEQLGIARSTFYHLQKNSLMPMSINIGPGARGVIYRELVAVLDARAAGASDEEIRQLVANLHAERKPQSGGNSA